ncbi:MAG: anti-sigma factor [Ignavibacteria bacterium]|nr:anti-sigma factor [Ignavibacteria bacterium]
MKINSKEYIESGILELYACGLLDEAEASQVNEIIKSNPEIAQELEEIRNTLAKYSMLYKISPDPALKNKVMKRIMEADKKIYQKIADDKTQEPEKPAKSKFRKFLMAALWVFFTVNVIINVFLYIKLRQTENIAHRLKKENSVLREDYERIRNEINRKSEIIRMVSNKGNKIFDLKGSAISLNSSATVFWNPETRKVLLSVHSLPAPPTDKQYQLWAIKGGKPVDAGVFNVTDEIISMEVPIESADTFAVTLEKKGGSPVPDLSQLYLIGEI